MRQEGAGYGRPDIISPSIVPSTMILIVSSSPRIFALGAGLESENWRWLYPSCNMMTV
jgi:hypothetical protein